MILTIITLSDFLSKPDAKCNWMFGYGSNMDRSHIEIKKNLTVLGKFSFKVRSFLKRSSFYENKVFSPNLSKLAPADSN